MSKVLKLKSLSTYIGAATDGQIVKKGQICRFSDDHAAKLALGSRKDKEGEDLPYWEECSDTVKTDFDFSKSARKVDRDDDEDAAPAASKPATRQRRPATTAAA